MEKGLPYCLILVRSGRETPPESESPCLCKGFFVFLLFQKGMHPFSRPFVLDVFKVGLPAKA